MLSAVSDSRAEGTDQGDDVVTASDIAALNAAAVARAAAFARIAGTVLVVAGLVGVAAWLWMAARSQQYLDDDGGGFSAVGFVQDDPSWLDRLDVLSTTITLGVSAVLAVGAGVLMRLAADYAVARTGGSLTGFQVGDAMPPESAEPADGDHAAWTAP